MSRVSSLTMDYPYKLIHYATIAISSSVLLLSFVNVANAADTKTDGSTVQKVASQKSAISTSTKAKDTTVISADMEAETDPIGAKVKAVQDAQTAEVEVFSEEAFLHSVFQSNLTPKILEQQRQSKRWSLHADYGDYDYMYGIQGNLTDDQTTKAATANAHDIKSNTIGAYVSKKSRYGVDSKVFINKGTNKYRTAVNLGDAKIKENTAELGISVSIDLLKNFLGRSNQADLDILEYNKILNDLDYKDALESFFVNASISYYKWVLAQKSLEINKGVLENANKILTNTINKRNKRGIIDNKTLLSQKANVTSIRGQVINLEEIVKTAAQELRFLTDYNLEINAYNPLDLQLSTREAALIDSINQGTDQVQLEELTAVKLSRIAADISNKSLEKAKSDKLPSLNLGASVTSGSYGSGSKGGELGDAVGFKDDPMVSLDLNFSHSFTNTNGNSTFQSAKYEQISNQLNYSLTQKRVTNDIQNARIQISKLYENYLNAVEHLNNEKAKYQNEIKEYNLGRSDIVDLINFQNSYLSAEDNYYSILLNLKIAIRSYLYLSNRMSILYDDLAAYNTAVTNKDTVIN